ncbi:AIPR family protein [Bacillaceae bacterium]
MDRITKSLLEEFVSQNGLESLSEDRQFEHFAGYLMTLRHYSESFYSEDVTVGAGQDCGIDCIAIIVNGSLVTEPEEIEDLAETNGYLDVTLVFVQAERSTNFDMQKIGQFSFGVQDFLSETPSLPQNERVKHKSKIVNEIFLRSGRFKKGNPQCYLYYVTAGRWTNDGNLSARRDAAIRDLENLNLFRKVSFVCIDAEKLQEYYRESKNAVKAEIVFPNRTVLPDLPRVEQAYLGLLSVGEFLKLVQNTDEEVITSIFYDNVRHWQDWNPVNKEIKETLENREQQWYFPLLNNGITIVAKEIIPTGNRFVIEDYQIVNGCQTTYVLHETRDVVNKDVLIPIRLIATQDVDVRNAIIKATNRQTEVTEDQLFALSDFPKKLEAYFPTFEGHKKLYYERRSRQYNSDPSVEKVRVINLTQLVRAFASIFLELPHRTTRNYKALLKQVGGQILNKDHRLEMYYLSGYASYRLEYLFRTQFLPPVLKPARYHLLMAFRLLVDSSKLPRFNSHEMVRFCNKILEVLWDEEAYKTVFRKAADIIETVADGNFHRDNIRTEPFTEAVKKEIQDSVIPN